MIYRFKAYAIVGSLLLFMLLVAAFAALAATPLTCGETLRTTLANSSTIDSYTLSVDADDAIKIVVRSHSGFEPYVLLTGPTGNVLYNGTYEDNWTFLETNQYDLTQGEYTLKISDYQSDEYGLYDVFWNKLNNPCRARPLACGQTIYASIDYHPEHDFYILKIPSTQTIVLTMSEYGPAYLDKTRLQLFNNQGTWLSEAEDDGFGGGSVTITYPNAPSGTYYASASVGGYLYIAYNETGDYSILFQNDTGTCPQVDYFPQKSHTYTYDGLSRLEEVENDDGSSIGYEYDGVGNRMALSITNAAASADPSAVDFGLVDTGAYQDSVVTVTNISGSSLFINSVSVHAAPFSIAVDNCSNQTLQPNGTCTTTARFSPTAAGQYVDAVIINTSSQVTPSLSVTLEGEGGYLLTAAKAGSGDGSVTSSPSGINCGSGCSQDSEVFAKDTQVTLTATADSNSTFEGWSGMEGCGTGSICNVTMAISNSVTASFSLNRTLTLTKEGYGTGLVVNSPAALYNGISCGTGCTGASAVYREGTQVTLTNSPGIGSKFTGWSGACSGTGAATSPWL